jgi:peroxiredoxin
VIEPGTPAPDFSLPDQDGNPVALSDFKGRNLVLAFYPLDFSPVCTDQLSIYQEVVGQIDEQGATLVGVSVDSAYCHKAFRDHLNLTIPLLADFNPKGEVAQAYGSYIDKAGIAKRNLVLIGEDGKVAWSHESPSPAEIPGANLIFDALAEGG